MKRRFCIYLILFLLLISCARERPYVEIIKPPPKSVPLPGKKTGEVPDFYEVNGERYYPLPDSVGFVQTGKASWYGEKFHGRPTSSGETFDMNIKSAAHKTLPLGTYVKVLNLSNNKYTIVRINDRGPFIKGRIIDLSYKAAQEISLIGPGVAEVKITALGKETGEIMSEKGPQPLLEVQDLKTGEFTVQIGAFTERSNAERLASRLKVIFDYVNISRYVDANNNTLFRLYVSKSSTLAQAGEFEKKLEDLGFTEAFIVRI